MIKIFLILNLLLTVSLVHAQSHKIEGLILDQTTHTEIIGATIRIAENRNIGTVSDTLGHFSIVVETMDNHFEISMMGYETLYSSINEQNIYYLSSTSIALKEVVVTATESHGIMNTSKIGREAIGHIQPSSFSDLLELLPGGRASDPVLNTPQLITLRAVAISSEDYNTSSLGTKFLIDGIPVNNDANLQSSPQNGDLYENSFVNGGVDMRSISTDDIENVEIVRGIPSVEYGDLTSGLITVKRKQGGNKLEARFKSDMQSKMFYVGKGFEFAGKNRLTMNIGLNFLDSQSDPRNNRQNYKRITGSYRIGTQWKDSDKYLYTLKGNLDYTGSIDNVKADKDLDEAKRPIATYKSSYHRIVLGSEFTIQAKQEQFFKKLSIIGAVTTEFDKINRWKYVALGSEVPLSTSVYEGEHDVTSVPTQYEATLIVDGKPFYAYFKTTALFEYQTPFATHTLKMGADWNMNKNYGRGLVFNTELPFSVDMNLRPRKYSTIPAHHQIAAFLEQNSVWNFGGYKLESMIGVRPSVLLNIGSQYELQGKLHCDPRINLHLEFPSFEINAREVKYSISGGLGWHTKYPTVDQLHPNDIYYDVVQFNYWPTDIAKRRINMLVTKINPTNYSLKVARNFKWEVRGDAQWNGYSFSLTYFQEDMKTGFRNSSEYSRIVYKDYDEQSIDKNTLTGAPNLETIPYSLDTLLISYGHTTNGSQILKKGIEFTFSTKRIQPLRTKMTVTGAWFKSYYSNVQAEYYRPSVVVAGKAYPYVGLYKDEDRYLREMFNTNFTFDTQITRFGLIFSSSFQCVWFSGSQNKACNPYPIAYLDKDLNVHTFEEADKSNGILSQMVKSVSVTDYYDRIPFCMNVNLKVTQRLYQNKMSVAVFVNKIVDYNPSYTNSMGVLKRRNVQPYFGMELNLKL